MLYYPTGNKDKIANAKYHLDELNIPFEAKKLKLIEIQSDSIEEVAISKAEQAFEILKSPLFVNDAGWYIPALNGFPGPYMKYINQWFSSQDLLDLMQNHQNREVTLKEVVVYKDKKYTKVFTGKSKGVILNHIRGEGSFPSDRVISIDSDGRSIAERKASHITITENDKQIWDDFTKWYLSIV